jgi:hypothetical protein
MKCDCDDCNGTGRCQECGGSGQTETRLERFSVDEKHPRADELNDLKSDALRVLREADTLCQLRPDRTLSYRAQCDNVLAEINRQADKIQQGKKP